MENYGCSQKVFGYIFQSRQSLKKTPLSINAVIFCRTSRDLFGIIAKLWLCKLCIVYKKFYFLFYFLNIIAFFKQLLYSCIRILKFKMKE